MGWFDENKEAAPLPQDYDDPNQAPPGYHWERISGGHVLLPGDRRPAPAPVSAPPRSPPTPNPTTPGISSPDVSNATYGKKIPISALGLARIGGSIIFGPYIEAGHASFGVSFGVPADPTGTRELREIAFDSKVGWTSADGFTGEPFTFRFYPGTQTQDADPLEIANFPDEPVAYRPQILLFFENLPLESFQNKIPYVAAVIADTTDGDDPADGINLGTALERIARSPWTTYTPETFEAVNVIDIVGGILLADDYSFIQLLQYISRIYRNLDIVQTDKLRIKDHGAHVTPDIRLDLSHIISSDSPVQFQRQEAAATPRELELVTIDPDADYVWVSAKAQRPRDPVVTSASVGKETVTLPLIMNAATRTSMVYFAQYAEEAARKKVTFGALAYGYQIEPGDRVALIDIGDGIENEVFKITKTMHGANCVVQCEAETIMRCSLEFSEDEGAFSFLFVSAASPAANDYWAVSASSADGLVWININSDLLIPISGSSLSSTALTCAVFGQQNGSPVLMAGGLHAWPNVDGAGNPVSARAPFAAISTDGGSTWADTELPFNHTYAPGTMGGFVTAVGYDEDADTFYATSRWLTAALVYRTITYSYQDSTWTLIEDALSLDGPLPYPVGTKTCDAVNRSPTTGLIYCSSVGPNQSISADGHSIYCSTDDKIAIDGVEVSVTGLATVASVTAGNGVILVGGWDAGDNNVHRVSTDGGTTWDPISELTDIYGVGAGGGFVPIFVRR